MDKADAQDLTIHLLDKLKSFGMADTFMIVPSVGLSRDSIRSYWQILSDSNRLQGRWGDTRPEDLNVDSITDYSIATANTYFVVETVTGRLIGEFALDMFTGKAATMHFSMNPYNSPSFNRDIGILVTDCVLNNWNNVVNLEESYLDTLIGVTPVDNRAACIYLRRAGFKPIGTIASGTKYEGEVTDALLSTKERQH